MTEMTGSSNQSWVGIDVSKNELYVCIDGSAEVERFEQTGDGYRQLAALLPKAAHVLVEATGGYERKLVEALRAQSFVVTVLNPRQVRDFARSFGKLGKTDVADARLIAEFGKRMTPAAQTPMDASIQRLRVLRTRQRQLTDMRSQERNRLDTVTDAMRSDIDEHIDWLTQKIDAVKDQIAELIRRDPALRTKNSLMQSVPCVGPTVAATLLAELSELGSVSHKQIAALAGLAPFARDSGCFKGRRMIAGGRPHIRTVLYMAVISGLRYNPVIRAFYDRLRTAGKTAKVAITACMRRLLVWLNSILRDQAPWNPQSLG